jgi:hypothetical protein
MRVTRVFQGKATGATTSCGYAAAYASLAIIVAPVGASIVVFATGRE